MIKKLKEDSTVPLNNVSSGSVEGIGVGEKGEPGIKKKKRLKDIVMKPMLTRKS